MLTVDQIAGLLPANLAEQGVTGVPVEYGSERQARTQGPARVVVGLLPEFRNEPAQGEHAPGPEPIGDQVARAIYARSQDFAVWVRGAPPPKETPAGERVRAAQLSTAALMHRVTAALWNMGPNTIQVRGGTWIDLDQADFTYGALLQLKCLVLIPVLNDYRQRITGELVPGETTVFTVSADGTEELAVSTPAAP